MATEVVERPHLLSLPVELIFDIWRYFDKKTLKSLRLSSKACHEQSTQPLFQHFTIYPHTRSFERLIHLSEAPKIAKHVEQLDYNTVMLGLTEMINRRLASVYSAQISEADRKEVADHARKLHDQNLRADAAYDEAAQMVHLQKVLPNLPNLRSVIVLDSTGLQRPSLDLMVDLPHFYQELVDETCGRFEHTRLERHMFGTPRCNGGSYSYSRPVLMALHTARGPIERLILRGIRWPALLSNDLTKHMSLLQGFLPNIKHLEITQSHSPFFPGPICMAQLQLLLSKMVDLEQLELSFRENHEIDIGGTGKELRDMLNDVRCISHFAGSNFVQVGEPLPARLNWSPKLRGLTLAGMICTGSEMRSLLRHCATSLKVLHLGDLVLMPEVSDGPRSCLVNLIKWMRNRLNLEHVELFGKLTNGGMQNWVVWHEEGTDHLSARVHHYILKGGQCPLEHVAIPPGYCDLGKKIYTADVPESLETEAFNGDETWTMLYEEDEEEEWGDDESDWTEDDDHDIMFGPNPDLEDDYDSEGGMFPYMPAATVHGPTSYVQIPGVLGDSDNLNDDDT